MVLLCGWIDGWMKRWMDELRRVNEPSAEFMNELTAIDSLTNRQLSISPSRDEYDYMLFSSNLQPLSVKPTSENRAIYTTGSPSFRLTSLVR